MSFVKDKLIDNWIIINKKLFSSYDAKNLVYFANSKSLDQLDWRHWRYLIIDTISNNAQVAMQYQDIWWQNEGIGSTFLNIDYDDVKSNYTGTFNDTLGKK